MATGKKKTEGKEMTSQTTDQISELYSKARFMAFAVSDLLSGDEPMEETIFGCNLILHEIADELEQLRDSFYESRT